MRGVREKGETNGMTRERNEREILAAAERVFAQHGYRGASLQAIAEQAGLPKSNVLYYMGNKRGLYVRLLERMMERWNALLDDISVEDDPAEVLEAFIRSKMQLSRRHPEGSRLFAAEILGGAPFLQEYLSGELRDWEHRIKDWVAANDACRRDILARLGLSPRDEDTARQVLEVEVPSFRRDIAMEDDLVEEVKKTLEAGIHLVRILSGLARESVDKRFAKIIEDAGIKLEHVVYRGSSLVMKDLLAGHILDTMDNLPPYLQHIQSGPLRALGVSSAKRWFSAPDVPTIDEAGVQNAQTGSWTAVLAPAGTPQAVIDKLSAAIRIGKEEGMQLFNDSLYGFLQKEFISRATAFEVSPNVEELKMMIKGIDVKGPAIL